MAVCITIGGVLDWDAINCPRDTCVLYVKDCNGNIYEFQVCCKLAILRSQGMVVVILEPTSKYQLMCISCPGHAVPSYLRITMLYRFKMSIEELHFGPLIGHGSFGQRDIEGCHCCSKIN